MAENSKIQWTGATMNALAGCTKVDAACANCYAIQTAHRLANYFGQQKYVGTTRLVDGRPQWTGKINFDPAALTKFAARRKPQFIFVNSMSDLFHEDVSLEIIQRHFNCFRLAHWHTYQILTKRAARLEELSPQLDWQGNTWMGVSIGTRQTVYRADHLQRSGAKIRFLSLEPLLEPLDDLNLDGIHWVIVGGESAKRTVDARPLRVEWVRSIIAQCRAARVPVFVKQLGATALDGEIEIKMLDGHGGEPAEWPDDVRVREMPVHAVQPNIGV